MKIGLKKVKSKNKNNTMPLFMGKAIYESTAADKKELVIIPGAGHNDLSTAF